MVLDVRVGNAVGNSSARGPATSEAAGGGGDASPPAAASERPLVQRADEPVEERDPPSEAACPRLEELRPPAVCQPTKFLWSQSLMAPTPRLTAAVSLLRSAEPLSRSTSGQRLLPQDVPLLPAEPSARGRRLRGPAGAHNLRAVHDRVPCRDAARRLPRPRRHTELSAGRGHVAVRRRARRRVLLRCGPSRIAARATASRRRRRGARLDVAGARAPWPRRADWCASTPSHRVVALPDNTWG